MVRALSPPRRRNLALAKQMIKVKRIDHVAIAVAERDAAAASLSALFGLATGAREHVASQATDVAFLHRPGQPAGRRRAGALCAARKRRARSLFGAPRARPAPRLLRGRGSSRCARRAEGGGRPPHRRDAAPGRARSRRRLPAPRLDGRRAVRALRGVRRRERLQRSFPAGAGERRPVAFGPPGRRADEPRRLRRARRRRHAAAPRRTEKEEGPAEEAPEENRPADLEPLSGYADQNKKKMQIFELNGYLRLRDDYMHDFFLGLGYSTVPSGSTVPGTDELRPAPFPGSARLPVAGEQLRRRRRHARDAEQPWLRTAGPRTSAARTCASASSRRST